MAIRWVAVNIVWYARSKFIRRVKVDKVDYVFKTRPEFDLSLYQPYYSGSESLDKVARDIPRVDAHWIGVLLKQLSTGQIAEAFRAAGFTPGLSLRLEYH